MGTVHNADPSGRVCFHLHTGPSRGAVRHSHPVIRTLGVAALALLATACQTIQTTQPGAVGVDRKHRMLVSQQEYAGRAATAVGFLEGRTIQPIDRVVAGMMAAADRGDFDGAVRWREWFEHLEWLFAALNRPRGAIDLLTFVYRDPGEYGDERAYLIRRGVVRATFPWPDSPIEREAFKGVVRQEMAKEEPANGPLPSATLDEMLLLLRWFRQNPEALRRTKPLERWA